MIDTSNKKAIELARQWGHDDPLDLMEEVHMDSVQPGICMTLGCEYTTDVEPDQREGWCEFCEAGTVKSISVLLGVL
jgi:hypothetical protein